MAKKNTTKKNNFPMIAIKCFIIGTFCIFFVFVCTNKTLEFFKTSRIFTIKNVGKSSSLQSVESQDLQRLLGQNIFSVDLQYVQRRLQGQYPEIDQLKVLRKFPDTLYLNARQREPFAHVAVSDHDIILDKEGFVLSLDAESRESLPAIEGITIEGTVLGKPIKRQDVSVALDIIRNFQENEHLQSYQMASIDVANLSKINFYLSNNLKVIIDRDKISQKIKKLGILLSQGQLDFKKINYIDLRFKEPILSQSEGS